MLRRILAVAFLSSALTATAADSPVARLLKEPASAMDVGMAVLSTQLSAMAFSEYDALGKHAVETRFIPHEVFAYYLDEPSGKNIHIVARFRHADPALTKEKVGVMCQRMIHWVRFHLGLHDDGSPLTRFDDAHASTMYEFIGSSTMSTAEMAALAPELDAQTIVMGDIGYVGGGAGQTGYCKDALVPPQKK